MNKCGINSVKSWERVGKDLGKVWDKIGKPLE